MNLLVLLILRVRWFFSSVPILQIIIEKLLTTTLSFDSTLSFFSVHGGLHNNLAIQLLDQNDCVLKFFLCTK